ncbi:MAG TPA: M12 family metallopeptidase [Candidatus Nanoarchaeia archaeon]|nr:M12 family metallopeptidase [Candidatus Nanoarchaeia archaeon]
MNYKFFLSLTFIIFVGFLLIFYWFFPLNTIEFGEFNISPKNYNFSEGVNDNLKMQFYPNMRYQDKDILYNIDSSCNLQKKNDMVRAFETLSNITILKFYPTEIDEEIMVTCDEKTKIEGELFVAGEGGPTNASKIGEKYIIFKGKILLIKKSECERPNIAIHELLHALGFDHSSNKNNIMYNITKCSQTIGDDIPKLINEIYSEQPLPDLSFENVSATIKGRYLNTEIIIRNIGLKDSPKFKIIIYTDGKDIKEFEIDSLNIGYGTTISIQNLFISQISTEKLEYEIKADFQEFDKENNRIALEIKK